MPGNIGNISPKFRVLEGVDRIRGGDILIPSNLQNSQHFH